MLCADAFVAFAGDQVEQQVIDASAGAGVKLWPSQPPAGCPFKADRTGVNFPDDNMSVPWLITSPFPAGTGFGSNR